MSWRGAKMTTSDVSSENDVLDESMRAMARRGLSFFRMKSLLATYQQNELPHVDEHH